MSIDILDKAQRNATANMATVWADHAGRLKMKMVDAQVLLTVELSRLAARGDVETMKNLTKIMEALDA
jgi:hypothetical protein